ncbi:MAG: HDOD domain-containing protein [Fibrobacterota bacterium]
MNTSEDIEKKKARIKRVAEKIIGLPTLPTVVAKMMELVDNPKTSANSLANLISTDQALTAKILKLANSAYYGFPREVGTVSLAIVVLGFNTVKDMGLSVSVFNAFEDSTNDNKYFDLSRFWEHSIGCAVASKMLARNYGFRITGEAFVGGLLHDIGKVVVNGFMYDDFEQIMKKVFEEDKSLIESELVVLGATHNEVGSWVAEKWNMPGPIVEVIKYHHDPQKAEKNKEFVLIVHLADYLCRISNIGVSGNKAAPVLTEEVIALLDKYNLPSDAETIDNARTDFLVELDKAETFMNFVRGEEGDKPE